MVLISDQSYSCTLINKDRENAWINKSYPSESLWSSLTHLERSAHWTWGPFTKTLSGPTINIEHERQFDTLNGLVMAYKKETSSKGCLCSYLVMRSLDYARDDISILLIERSSNVNSASNSTTTIGLLPMPRNPIISTCAGTDEEPANCASECIRPMVSVTRSDLNISIYLIGH